MEFKSPCNTVHKIGSNKGFTTGQYNTTLGKNGGMAITSGNYNTFVEAFNPGMVLTIVVQYCVGVSVTFCSDQKF